MSRAKHIFKVSIINIITNFILVGFKATVGLLAGSITIVLDAVNNLSDALSAIIAIIGTALAGKRPDKKHPYGHGRIGYFSSLLIAFLILAAGIAAVKEAITSIIDPIAPEYNVISLVIIAVAVLTKFVLGNYMKRAGHELNSSNLTASGIDATWDGVLSLATLVGALFNFLLGFNIEGYLGVIIGIFILRSALEISRETFSEIIGGRADPDLARKIKKKIASFPGVLGVYDLSLHNYGPSSVIGSAHIEVDDDTTAKTLHALTRQISVAIYEKYGVVLTIGIYAFNNTTRATKMRGQLEEILKDYPDVLELHGFYVDFSAKQISFDLVLDFAADQPTKLQKEIKAKLHQLYPDYQIGIILDLDTSD